MKMHDEGDDDYQSEPGAEKAGPFHTNKAVCQQNSEQTRAD